VSRTIATAIRAVRDRLAKLPRSQRWIAGGVAGAILVAAAVATAASASTPTPTAQPTGVRVDQRANRSEVRATTTPSIAPSTLAPSAKATPTPAKPAPKPTTARPVAPKPSTAKPVAPKPLAVPTSCSHYSGAQRTACALLPSFGFSTSEMAALIPMWDRESGWSYTAANPSGAYGIPQALPGSKMAVYGSDWQTNPATQIKWGLSYIKSRYGTPSAAWAFWQSNGWY
jgi:hypothetical protein